MNATLTDLYSDSADRLADRAAALLAADTPHLDGQLDDVTQEVWLRAAQQDPLPDWAWLVAEASRVVEEVAGRWEEAAGLRPVADLVDFDFTEPILDTLASRPVVRTPEEFRAEHGDLARWDAVDFEVFENLARTQVPVAEVVDFPRKPPVCEELPLAA